ncbi:Pepsin A [Durusdinium trenchii]|uniref:Pepsin A n=1 Tax=Durusdinium trenchii TaxID=1381693 RepID=A0ABP0SEV5_9DINO
MPALSRSKDYNFLGNIAEARQLQKDRFAVWLSKQVDQEDAEISFGEIPMNRLSSDIVWFPLSSTVSGLWQVSLKDLTVNLVRQGLCKKQACHVAFDTGVELGDRVFNIEKYEYVQKSSEGCFVTPFLERYVTIYDRVFLRMGLAFALHKAEPTGESTQDAAQRLMGRQALGKLE